MKKQKTLPIVCAAFLVIAMTVQFLVSYRRETADLMQQMEYKMESAQKDFIFEMYDMHEATDEITHFFPEFDDHPEDLYALLRTVLSHYTDLYCCYVVYFPECAPKRGQWSCPTAFRVKGDSIITYDGGDGIDYAERDWYIGALNSDEGHWSLPYNDGTHADPVFTYSQKVYDGQDKLVGVAGADYTLVWTEQLLEDIKPYDDAVCRLFSTDGTLIVGSGDTTRMRDMIQFEKVLEPTDMRLVLNVPKCHIRRGITGISLITLSVLLAGILIIGLLLHYIKKEQDAYTRIEMANKVIEKEMQIAHDIQMGILKGERLMDNGERDDVHLEAKLIPMREVGGDLYDYLRKGDKLWFIIGDVSGKGVPAAMFMSAAVNLFRAAGVHASSPREIMEEMNAVLSENNPSLTFVTAIIGCLHVSTGELLYCNAGHCVPLIVERQKTKVESLPIEPNIPLGFDAKYRFVEQGVLLGEGDTLVLYTDGITEARNEQHKMLGFARWQTIIESGEQNVENLIDDVKKFIGNAEQTDDITLMTIRKTSPVELLTLRVENRMDNWRTLRAALHDYGLCAGLDARTLKKTEVAIEEAVVNIVSYSQAEWMELEIKVESGKRKVERDALSITLRDNGVPFDPTQQPDVDTERTTAERQIGGLGIALLRNIADEMRYERTDGTNTLTIIKQL